MNVPGPAEFVNVPVICDDVLEHLLALYTELRRHTAARACRVIRHIPGAARHCGAESAEAISLRYSTWITQITQAHQIKSHYTSCMIPLLIVYS